MQCKIVFNNSGKCFDARRRSEFDNPRSNPRLVLVSLKTERGLFGMRVRIEKETYPTHLTDMCEKIEHALGQMCDRKKETVVNTRTKKQVDGHDID